MTPLFTGYTRDGGYADARRRRRALRFPLPRRTTTSAAAPLLCAGLIGWRSLRMAGDGRQFGLYGFGAAAHIIARSPVAQGREVFRLHPPRRRGSAGLRARTRAPLGRRLRRDAAGELDCGHHLRAGRRARAGGAGGGAQGRHGGLRRHPHE